MPDRTDDDRSDDQFDAAPMPGGTMRDQPEHRTDYDPGRHDYLYDNYLVRPDDFHHDLDAGRKLHIFHRGADHVLVRRDDYDKLVAAIDYITTDDHIYVVARNLIDHVNAAGDA